MAFNKFSEMDAAANMTLQDVLEKNRQMYLSPDAYVKQVLTADPVCSKIAVWSGEMSSSKLATLDSQAHERSESKIQSGKTAFSEVERTHFLDRLKAVSSVPL